MKIQPPNWKAFLWHHCIVPFMTKRSWAPTHATELNLKFELMRFGYDDEQEIKQAARIVSTHTMVSFERLATLWLHTRHLDKKQIPGSFVECGVWRGGSCGMMALAHSFKQKPFRQIHMFDSFEGLPEPVASHDGTKAIGYAQEHASGKLAPIGKCVGPLQDNRFLMENAVKYPKELIHYHKGWFEKTLPDLDKNFGPIALLRIDGDWYESTKVCLKHLYDRVSPGGIIVIDDYGHWEGCKKAVDEFLAEHNLIPYLHHIDYTGRYFFKDS